MIILTHDEFSQSAKAYGFGRVYFTEPMAFDLGGNRFGLIADVKKEYPFAECIAVLLYPYSPFSADEYIPSYYIASNKAYHALKAFTAELNGRGMLAEKADIPVKMQLTRSYIGSVCRNSLIAFEDYGTRVVLLSLAIKGLPPKEYAEKNIGCGKCTACINACPAGAVDESGFTFNKCIRFHMNPADHPDSIRDVQKTYIGCEICQYACPRNKKLSPVSPSDDLQRAFGLKRLITGDTSEARKYAGKNFTGGGKLTAEAIVFAARRGLYQNEIRACRNSEFEAVRNAAVYAEKFFKKGYETK